MSQKFCVILCVLIFSIRAQLLTRVIMPSQSRILVVTSSCSQAQCFDPNCSPQVCPKIYTQNDPNISSIANQFQNFLNALETIISTTKSSCPNDNNFSPIQTLTQCTSSSSATQTSLNLISLKFEEVPFGTSRKLTSAIPLNSSIITQTIMAISGSFFVQIIYYYQEKYYYVCYDTGMRVPVKKANDNNPDLTDQQTSPNSEYFDALRNAPIREAAVARDLTTLLKCLANASEFRLVDCTSTNTLSNIMPIAV